MNSERDIIDYEGLYSVSECGDIFSYRFYRTADKKKLKATVCGDGYLTVTLYKDGRRENRTVHSLVAKHFVNNPLNLPQVNHKDGNKLNCHKDNLEWCTSGDNTRHAVRMGLRDTSKNACKKQLFRW